MLVPESIRASRRNSLIRILHDFSFLIQLCNKIKREFMFVIILKTSRKPEGVARKRGFNAKVKSTISI